jgi:two-component system, NtrC family, sensor kinase
LYEDLPAVECDPAQIEQVFLALMINAMDAMPRGGNLLLATNLCPDSEHVQIEIRDDGAGIPPDILSQIFEPFVTTKETGHGVGLGLAISQGIVERHHGRIEVESEVGRGTTFRITLPVTVSEVERASIGTHATVA